MGIMEQPRKASPFPWPSRRKSHLSFRFTQLCVAFAGAAFAMQSAAYVLENSRWPKPSTVSFRSQLGTPTHSLQDGSRTWDSAVSPVFAMWNSVIGGVRMTSVTASAAVASGDGINSIAFSQNVFGQAFGSSTLAVTYRRYTQNSVTVETDVLFNKAQSFDSYRGALRFGSNGYAIADIRRVLLHELGHALGLDHPDTHGQHLAAVMNSIISNQETLSADDKAGGQALYGAPSSTPSPSSRLGKHFDAPASWDERRCVDWRVRHRRDAIEKNNSARNRTIAQPPVESSAHWPIRQWNCTVRPAH